MKTKIQIDFLHPILWKLFKRKKYRMRVKIKGNEKSVKIKSFVIGFMEVQLITVVA